jgi:hypothetical protein
MIKALVISNGIEGLEKLYQSNHLVQYSWARIDRHFHPSFDEYDVLIVPNGTDHVAMYRIRHLVAEFLKQGKTLLCFDGWFTDWVPGNRWIMDNSKPSKEVRYLFKDDTYGFKDQFSLSDMNFMHGISGWWACGYIEPAPRAQVLVQDTWGRALVVIDERSTNGRMLLTASGPLAEACYATIFENEAHKAMADFYKAVINWAKK